MNVNLHLMVLIHGVTLMDGAYVINVDEYK